MAVENTKVHFLKGVTLTSETNNHTFLLAGPSQDVFLLPTSHRSQGGSILLVHYSLIILKTAILVFNGRSDVRSHAYLQLP